MRNWINLKRKQKRKGFEGKKGNAVLDSLTVVFILFLLATVSIVMFVVMDGFNDSVQSDFTNNESKDIMQTQTTNFPTIWDGVFLFLVVGLWGAAIVMSFLVDSHPIFIFASLLLLMFVLIIGAVTANAYDDFSNEPEIQSFADSFPFINFVYNHFLGVILAIAFSVLMVQFAKSRL